MELITNLEPVLRLTAGEVAALCGLRGIGTRLFGELVDEGNFNMVAGEGQRSLVARCLLGIEAGLPTISPDLEPFVDALTGAEGLLSVTSVEHEGGQLAIALVHNDALLAVSPVTEGVISFVVLKRSDLDGMIAEWLSAEKGDRVIHLSFEPLRGATVQRTWTLSEGGLSCDGTVLESVPDAPTSGLELRQDDSK